MLKLTDLSISLGAEDVAGVEVRRVMESHLHSFTESRNQRLSVDPAPSALAHRKSRLAAVLVAAKHQV